MNETKSSDGLLYTQQYVIAFHKAGNNMISSFNRRPYIPWSYSV